jgi:hypothetical protein
VVIATHDVNVVPVMADQVFVLLRGGEIVARGTPHEVFSDPGLLRRSNIEPPVLSELFQRLAELGHDLGHPIDLEAAARALLGWGGAAGDRSRAATVDPPRAATVEPPRAAPPPAPAAAPAEPPRASPEGPAPAAATVAERSQP